jgi:hypothetical protein
MGASIEVIEEAEVVDTKKVVTLAIGGTLGALIGLAAAYLLWKNAEKSGGEIEVSASEGISLGLLVMGLLRQVAKIGT